MKMEINPKLTVLIGVNLKKATWKYGNFNSHAIFKISKSNPLMEEHDQPKNYDMKSRAK